MSNIITRHSKEHHLYYERPASIDRMKAVIAMERAELKHRITFPHYHTTRPVNREHLKRALGLFDQAGKEINQAMATGYLRYDHGIDELVDNAFHYIYRAYQPADHCVCEDKPERQPCEYCRMGAIKRFYELYYGSCTCRPDGDMCTHCRTWSRMRQ